MHSHEKGICFVYIKLIPYLGTVNLKRIIIIIDNYFHLFIGLHIANLKHDAHGTKWNSPQTKIKTKQSWIVGEF